MSLFTAQLSLLTLRPSIRESRDSVIIKTGFLTGLCTLFLSWRRVEILPSRRRVLLSSRKAYLFTSHEVIEFTDVWYVDYSFGSLGTDWGWTSAGFGRHDQVESFSISIVTKDDKRHVVCAFRGEGSTCTGWTGVLLGDDEILDFSGTQEKESRKLAQYLAKLLGVRIGKPLEAIADMATCPACGRSTSLYKAKCLYCGAQVNEAPNKTD
jgi:hypothetical protein